MHLLQSFYRQAVIFGPSKISLATVIFERRKSIPMSLVIDEPVPSVRLIVSVRYEVLKLSYLDEFGIKAV